MSPAGYFIFFIMFKLYSLVASRNFGVVKSRLEEVGQRLRNSPRELLWAGEYSRPSFLKNYSFVQNILRVTRSEQNAALESI